MASCMVEDSIIQDTIVPSNRKTVYVILLEVELRHDGQQAQQHLAAAGQQQHATYRGSQRYLFVKRLSCDQYSIRCSDFMLNTK